MDGRGQPRQRPPPGASVRRPRRAVLLAQRQIGANGRQREREQLAAVKEVGIKVPERQRLEELALGSCLRDVRLGGVEREARRRVRREQEGQWRAEPLASEPAGDLGSDESAK